MIRALQLYRALNRLYLADLLARKLQAPCPVCKARPGKPCRFDQGPRKGTPMAGAHFARADEAARRGYLHPSRLPPGARRR